MTIQHDYTLLSDSENIFQIFHGMSPAFLEIENIFPTKKQTIFWACCEEYVWVFVISLMFGHEGRCQIWDIWTIQILVTLCNSCTHLPTQDTIAMKSQRCSFVYILCFYISLFPPLTGQLNYTERGHIIISNPADLLCSTLQLIVIFQTLLPKQRLFSMFH